MKDRKEITDNRPDTDVVLTQLIMLQTPTERLAAAVAASNRVARQCKNAILRANPGICPEEAGLRFIEINYGLDLANAVRNFLAESK